MLTQIVAVIVRLFAIWLALQSLRALSPLFGPNSADWSFAFLGGLGALEVGVAVFLWNFPFTVARKLCPIDESSDFESLTPSGLYTAGIVVVGIYWLTRGLHGMTYWGMYLLYAGRNEASISIEPPDAASIANTIVQFVLGALLIVGRHRIRALIHKVRFGGANLNDF